MHTTARVGQPKVESGRAALLQINPDDRGDCPARARATARACAELVAAADVVLDCSDNFATRHAVNRACVAAARAAGGGRRDPLRRPDLACSTRATPRRPATPACSREDSRFEDVACSTMGVFAPLVGVIGAMQAAEALKLLAGVGESLAGRLLMLDGRTWNGPASAWRATRPARCAGLAGIRATALSARGALPSQSGRRPAYNGDSSCLSLQFSRIGPKPPYTCLLSDLTTTSCTLLSQNLPHRCAARRRQRGFTLVEIMVVVVIIGILGALVVPKLLGRTGESRVTAAKVDIATLMQALKLYKLDNQRYPTTEQGLQALITEADHRPGRQRLEGRRLPRQAAEGPVGQSVPVPVARPARRSRRVLAGRRRPAGRHRRRCRHRLLGQLMRRATT